MVQPVPLVPLLQPAKDFSVQDWVKVEFAKPFEERKHSNVQEAKVGTEIVSERPKDSKDIQRPVKTRNLCLKIRYYADE